MVAHAFGEGYVPMVNGRTHLRLFKSRRHKSLKVVLVDVHPPNTYIELSKTKLISQSVFF